MAQRDKTLDRHFDLLRRPGRELVLTCTRDTVSGRAFYIMPDGIRVTDETAQRIREHPLIQPHSPGLLPAIGRAGSSAIGSDDRGDDGGDDHDQVSRAVNRRDL